MSNRVRVSAEDLAICGRYSRKTGKVNTKSFIVHGSSFIVRHFGSGFSLLTSAF